MITGGSRGIGASIVKRLARRGVNVAFTYASKSDEANKIAEEIKTAGGHALAIKADNTDADAIVAAVELTVRD